MAGGEWRSLSQNAAMEKHAVPLAVVVLATLFVGVLAFPQQAYYRTLRPLTRAGRLLADERSAEFAGSFAFPTGPALTPTAAPAPELFAPEPAAAPPFIEPEPAPARSPTAAPAPSVFAPEATVIPLTPTAAPAPAVFSSVPAASFAPAPAPGRRPSYLARPIIPVLRHSEVHDTQGQYALRFEAGNGIVVEEQGGLKKNVDGEWKDDFVLIKRGSYSYPGPDGRTYKLSYTADENGFHPMADYLPVVGPSV